jgi:hypothetical protein
MRCRGCDREIEVKWHQPAGAEAPILEDLCSLCLPWSVAVLRSAEHKADPENHPAPFWPKKAGLMPDVMEAYSDTAAGHGWTTADEMWNRDTQGGKWNRAGDANENDKEDET